MVFIVVLWVWVVLFSFAGLSVTHDIFVKETVKGRVLAGLNVISCIFVLYVFLLQLGIFH